MKLINIEKIYDVLINKNSNIDEIQPIGKTISPTLHLPNEGDIDILIFYDGIPEMKLSQKLYK